MAQGVPQTSHKLLGTSMEILWLTFYPKAGAQKE